MRFQKTRFYKLNSDGKSCVKSKTKKCAKGYELQNGVCQDINECRKFKSRYGRCKNTPGSAKFRCKKGFRFSRKDFDCLDINECKEGTSKCEDLCDNTKGGYVCKCLNPGYVLAQDEHSCIKKDEVIQDYLNVYENPTPDYEDENVEVIKVTQSTPPPCKIGYERNSYGECTDIDECELGMHACQEKCRNIEGSYVCECFEGRNLKENGIDCEDKVISCGLGYRRSNFSQNFRKVYNF